MLNYNAPADGIKSSIDGSNSDQMNTFWWLKNAIIESRKEQYFMPLATVTNMPKLPGIEGATNYSNNGGSSWAVSAANSSTVPKFS